MAYDYHAARRAYMAGAMHIGKAVTPDQAESGMNVNQLKRRRARNLMSDEVWQYRRLAGGALVVEIAYGWFIDHPVFGLSVWCVRDLARDAAEWDYSLSGAFSDVESLLARLLTLDTGGRERLEALAQAA